MDRKVCAVCCILFAFVVYSSSLLCIRGNRTWTGRFALYRVCVCYILFKITTQGERHRTWIERFAVYGVNRLRLGRLRETQHEQKGLLLMLAYVVDWLRFGRLREKQHEQKGLFRMLFVFEVC